MKNNILYQVLNYQNNKTAYSFEERKIIRQNIERSIDDKLNSFLDVFDKINNI